MKAYICAGCGIFGFTKGEPACENCQTDDVEFVKLSEAGLRKHQEALGRFHGLKMDKIASTNNLTALEASVEAISAQAADARRQADHLDQVARALAVVRIRIEEIAA